MEERIVEIEKRLKKIEENKSDVNTVVAVICEKLDNIAKIVDKLSSQYEKNILEMNTKYDKLEDKYDKLKEELNEKTIGRSANNWNTILLALGTGIVGVVVTLLFK